MSCRISLDEATTLLEASTFVDDTADIVAVLFPEGSDGSAPGDGSGGDSDGGPPKGPGGGH